MDTTLLQLRTKVKNQWADSSTNFAADSELTDLINEACYHIAMNGPVHLLKELIKLDAGYVLDANGRTTLPTDYVRLVEVVWEDIRAREVPPGYTFTRGNYNVVPNTQIEGDAHPIYTLVLEGSTPKAEFYPGTQNAEADYTYIKNPTTLSADGDKSDLHELWVPTIVLYVVWKLRLKEVNQEAAGLAQQHFETHFKGIVERAAV
jgi:hypothetical protein